MKTLKIVLAISLTSLVAHARDCQESTDVKSVDVVYNVNKGMPDYLKGATITIKLADGRESQVPAEKFMVVPRKQHTVAGQNKLISRELLCKSDNRNLLIGEVRKDVKDLDTTTADTEGGQEAYVHANKGLVPGINYFRREIVGKVGAGAGIDANGTPKAFIGIEF